MTIKPNYNPLNPDDLFYELDPWQNNHPFLEKIYDYGKDALRIGITGPPGCGKSTLTDQLIKQLLNDEKSVGVVAVDVSAAAGVIAIAVADALRRFPCITSSSSSSSSFSPISPDLSCLAFCPLHHPLLPPSAVVIVLPFPPSAHCALPKKNAINGWMLAAVVSGQRRRVTEKLSKLKRIDSGYFGYRCLEEFIQDPLSDTTKERYVSLRSNDPNLESLEGQSRFFLLSSFFSAGYICRSSSHLNDV